MARRREENTPYRCVRCRNWRGATGFANTRIHEAMDRRICKTCTTMVVKVCVSCGLERPNDAFTKSAWVQPRSHRKCNVFIQGRPCRTRGVRGDRHTFAATEWGLFDDTRRCLECMMKTCAFCGEEKRQLPFAADQWALTDGPRRCYVCNKTRCVRCHKLKVQQDVLPGAWNRADVDPEHGRRQSNFSAL